jgi:REP element-mobilizing transposase RayT
MHRSESAYLITFSCYGAHLHGDDRGSVDRRHNQPGTRSLQPDDRLLAAERHLMDQPPYQMDTQRRGVVLSAIRQTCEYRGWTLLAAHVRTTHVHVVVASREQPEKIMLDLKRYASRALNDASVDTPDRKRWARHGSTRRLPDAEAVSAAVRYVIERQGEPMALFAAP